mmetsp:Transcript_30773/g.69444  ORF Transcript_30773/g.69444 Transcript_30773/m.69444 type:complete len:243 (-) Transcript_30773:39-767(-)
MDIAGTRGANLGPSGGVDRAMGSVAQNLLSSSTSSISSRKGPRRSSTCLSASVTYCSEGGEDAAMKAAHTMALKPSLRSEHTRQGWCSWMNMAHSWREAARSKWPGGGCTMWSAIPSASGMVGAASASPRMRTPRNFSLCMASLLVGTLIPLMYSSPARRQVGSHISRAAVVALAREIESLSVSSSKSDTSHIAAVFCQKSSMVSSGGSWKPSAKSGALTHSASVLRRAAGQDSRSMVLIVM